MPGLHDHAGRPVSRVWLAAWLRARLTLDLGGLRPLLPSLRPHRLTLALALLATALTSGLGLVFPSLVGHLLDGALLRASLESRAALNRTVLLLLAVFVLRAGSGALQAYLLMTVGEAVVRDMRTRLFAHLLGRPQTFFDARRSGDLGSRLGGDVLSVQSVVSETLPQLAGQLVTLAGGLVVLTRVSPALTGVTLAVVPFVLLSAAVFGRRLERVSQRLRTQEAQAAAQAQEVLGNVRTVKAFATEAQEAGRYSALTAAAYGLALHRARVRALYGPVVGMLMACSVSLVLWWGGSLVQRGSLSAGTLIAFLLYTVTVTNALQALSGVHGQLREAAGAGAEVFALLVEGHAEEAPAGKSPPPVIAGHLRFEGLSFAYTPGGVPALHNLDLELRPGEIIALVGPSGAGKSTVAALLLRLYEPGGGRIVLDGLELHRYDVHALRRSIGLVPQDTQLFAASLRHNLTYGSPHAGARELDAAVRAAHLSELVASLPAGYDTLVGERGLTLSGGQRQRVAIARALLGDPRLLILDEATSALDSESERLVQQALETLMAGRSTLVIAHRLSTVRRAHQIVVLDGGRAVQRGTHDELLAQPGLYRLLYQQQQLSPGAAQPGVPELGVTEPSVTEPGVRP